jgi:hypothetical protein
MSEYIPPSLEESGSTPIEALRDRHKGQTAYIVGKGPSLANLRASDFGPGPVIVLNEAILTVQVLGLPNQIYSMQKDGCTTADPYTIPRPCGTCEPFGWQRPTVVNPYPGIAVVFSQHLSSWCLHGRDNRYVFTDAEFGYEGYPLTMSVLESVPLAKLLGAASIVMVSFDSLVTGDLGYFEEGTYTEEQIKTMRYNLEWVRPRAMAALAAFGPHSFYTPTDRGQALPIRRMLPVVDAA